MKRFVVEYGGNVSIAAESRSEAEQKFLELDPEAEIFEVYEDHEFDPPGSEEGGGRR